MWCYVNLYLRNRRFVDPFKLVLSHRALAAEMLWGFVCQQAGEGARGSSRSQPPRRVCGDPRVHGEADAPGGLRVRARARPHA
jgi:hypothetical protein